MQGHLFQRARGFKGEFRRPFTHGAEFMATFGLIEAGICIYAYGASPAFLLDDAIS